MLATVRRSTKWGREVQRAAGAFALLAALLVAACTTAPPQPLHVVILGTTDLHGSTRPREATWIDREKPPLAGGFPALAATIGRIRADAVREGAKVLVVDCGDFYQGTPEGDLPKGRLVVETMNEIGYGALALGNHDFEQGPANVEALATLAKFPFLGANIHRAGTKENPPWVRTIVDRPDLRLELVGLISSSMTSLTSPASRAGLEFEREEETLARLPRTPGRARVLIAHLGIDREREMAKSGFVDAVLGGHTHVRVAEKVGEVPLLQSGNQGTNLGRVDLWIDADGKVVRSAVDVLPVLVSEGEDPEVKALLDRYTPEIDRTMNVVVGELNVDLPREVDGRSSPLGNLICDLMRDATGAEVAIHNRTSMRRNLVKGKVRVRDLYEASPFRNTMVTMKLTGAELQEIFEHMVLKGRFRAEVSGAEFEYEFEPKRISDVTVGGAPLDPERLYLVVTNSHLASGGSGFTTFTKGRDVRDAGGDAADLLRAALEKGSPLSYESRARILPKPGTSAEKGYGRPDREN